MKFLLVLFLLALPVMGSGQTIYKSLSSEKLGEEREIKIQLPRNYEKNSDRQYPIMVVLDGDYLFEPIAGNIDFYSYWDDAPEIIVVGINQNGSRKYDGYYDENNFLPAGDGAAFFEFLGMELLHFIDNNYRISDFRIVVGHNFTANFINYYLLKPTPVFDAYINLSPDFAPEMNNRIQSALQRTESPKWYYMATGSDDIPKLKNNILAFDEQLKNIENQNLIYHFDNFEDTNHYTLAARAIPAALHKMFKVYGPISQKDYDEILLQDSISSVQYLTEKYARINKLFGEKKKIRINDFMAVYNAIEKTKRWEEYEALAKLATEHYPETMLSTFFKARYEEETNNPKQAIKAYRNAYGKENIAFLNIDYMLEKAEKIQQDFGY